MKKIKKKETYYRQLGPDLGALVGDDGEADHLILEAHPADLAQGREGRGELYM